MDWLAGVYLRSMRDAITAARGSWDLAREDAQFRAQLRITDTRVIRVDGRDVGLVAIDASDVGRVEVHTLCVHPERQGAGVGALIMRDIMKTAQMTGSAVELSVLTANPHARRFYARLGFVEIGLSTHHIRMKWEPGVGPIAR